MKKHSIHRLYATMHNAPTSINRGFADNDSSHTYLVNENAVICLFSHPAYDRPFKGVAKLDKEDKFDLEYGKKLATTRAHIKFHNRFVIDLNKQLDVLEEVYDTELAVFEKHRLAYVNLSAIEAELAPARYEKK